jgi:hypothetical protein
MFRPAISAIVRRNSNVKGKLRKRPLLYGIEYQATKKLRVAVSLQAFITSRLTGDTNPFIHNLETKWR